MINTNSIVQGLLGLGQVNENDLVVLEDSQLVEVMAGLGANKSAPRFKEATGKVAAAMIVKASRNANDSKRVLSVRPQDDRSMTGKAQFEKRFSQISDKDIVEGLANGTLTTSDHSIYSIRYGNTSGSIEMFKSSDSKKEGVTNIQNGRLANGEAFLVRSILFLGATGVDGAEATGAGATYAKIAGAEANGNYEFKNGQKIFIPECSLHDFYKDDSNELQAGELILQAPKIIQPATDIIFNAKLYAAPAVGRWFKVILKGMIVVKA